MKYKTGLVLSGGGSRGFAHIGAFEALEKAAICNCDKGIRDVAMRTFQLYVHAMNRDSSSECDLLIEPLYITGFGYLGSKRGMEMYRIGYDAVKKQLETFKNW